MEAAGQLADRSVLRVVDRCRRRGEAGGLSGRGWAAWIRAQILDGSGSGGAQGALRERTQAPVLVAPNALAAAASRSAPYLTSDDTIHGS